MGGTETNSHTGQDGGSQLCPDPGWDVDRPPHRWRPGAGTAVVSGLLPDHAGDPRVAAPLPL